MERTRSGRETPAPSPAKNPAAVALGRLGGSKGGKARAARLSPEQRKTIARNAARSRWGQGHAIRPPQRLRRSSLREKIIVLATKRFAERGFDGLTIRDIAAELRISLPTVYKCFADKRELYVTCCLDLSSAYTAELLDFMENLSEHHEKVYGFALAFCVMQSDPYLPKLIHRILLDKDAQILELLTHSGFPTQYEVVRGSVARIVGDEKAAKTAFSIYALGFGLIQLAPYSQAVPAIPKPTQLAVDVLSVTIPSVDWSDVARLASAKLSGRLNFGARFRSEPGP